MPTLKTHIDQAIRVIAVAIVAILFFTYERANAQTAPKTFDLGDFKLESGVVLRDAKLKYITNGVLNDEKSNAILVPSAYSGDHNGLGFLVQKGAALDPANY